ncbi:MAG: amidohydrolase [Candidatus Bathyarchaeia archaeon]
MSIQRSCEADLVLHNGRIVTVDDDFNRADSIAVRDGRFISVGALEDVKQLIGEDTEVIDLEGRMVLPGLVDSHIHMLGTGQALQLLNVRSPPMRSIDDIKDAVAERSSKVEAGDWVLGRGWDQAKLKEYRNPTRWDLDEAAPDNPVFLRRTCGHVAVVNSTALEIAGIRVDAPDPEGGRIVREDGEVTGILEERAMSLVERHIPEPSIEEKVEYIEEASIAFNQAGLTSVIEPGIEEEDMRTYQLALEEGKLTVRVGFMLRAVQGEEDIERSIKRIKGFPLRSGFGNDMLRFQGVKILIDGGIGGRTALLRQPYEGELENKGILTLPVDDLQRLVDAANINGMLTGIHAAGGRAMDIVMDVYEETDKVKPIRGRRFYLIHAYLPSEEIFEACRRLGVNVASQPSFLYYLGDSFHENIGPERGAWVKPHRAWIDEGVHVAAGTDSPVTPFNPFPSLWASIARRTEVEDTKMGEEQGVTREEVIRLYTINGAYLNFEEDVKGSIEPGKLADMIIIDRDILTCPEDDIKETRVLRTFLGGRTVYKAH